jgi:hypothetical protein
MSLGCFEVAAILYPPRGLSLFHRSCCAPVVGSDCAGKRERAEALIHDLVQIYQPDFELKTRKN